MIPLSLHQKRINLPKETNKNSYPENYDMLMKEIEEETQMERCIMFVDWSKQYCQNKKNDYTAQDNLEIQYNPCKITNGIFHKTRTNLKIYIETQKTLNSQSYLEKEEWSWRIRILGFRLYYKAMIIKTVWYWHKN